MEIPLTPAGVVREVAEAADAPDANERHLSALAQRLGPLIPESGQLNVVVETGDFGHPTLARFFLRDGHVLYDVRPAVRSTYLPYRFPFAAAPPPAVAEAVTAIDGETS